MVGTGGTRTELLPLASVNVDTAFGAYANRFIKDTTGPAALHGTSLDADEVLILKQSWHKIFRSLRTTDRLQISTRNHVHFQADASTGPMRGPRST